MSSALSGTAALQLKRWSRMERRPKTWAALCFMTWEELVLMHSTFVSLKAQNGLTVSLDPEEYTLRDEKKLFRARIFDDGFTHFLFVYQDLSTRALRLRRGLGRGAASMPRLDCLCDPSVCLAHLAQARLARVRLADVQLSFAASTGRRASAGGQAGLLRSTLSATKMRRGKHAQRFEDVFTVTMPVRRRSRPMGECRVDHEPGT